MVEELVVANPGERGPCGGVKRAAVAIDMVLKMVDGREPVRTNFKVVNNDPLMKRLSDRGLINVNNNWEEVPEGAILAWSAHGVPPYYHRLAEERGWVTVDMTCQLVTRVQMMVKKAVANGLHVAYVGVAGHPETESVLGQVPADKITLWQKPDDVQLRPIEADGIEVHSQTTLATDEMRQTLDDAKNRYGDALSISDRWSICPATDIRQEAVRAMEPKIDGLIVAGTPTKEVVQADGSIKTIRGSHNSEMLRQIVAKAGKPSILVDEPADIPDGWLDHLRVVGLTSGASVLDPYMQPFCNYLRKLNPCLKETVMDGSHNAEKTFSLPIKDLEKLEGHLMRKYGYVPVTVNYLIQNPDPFYS